MLLLSEAFAQSKAKPRCGGSEAAQHTSLSLCDFYNNFCKIYAMCQKKYLSAFSTLQGK